MAARSDSPDGRQRAESDRGHAWRVVGRGARSVPMCPIPGVSSAFSLRVTVPCERNTRMVTEDEAMRRAIALAARGLGTTSPNPVVGCLLLDAGGEVVGEGFHAYA